MKKLIALTVIISAVAVASTSAADGKALYEKDCAKCHGADGKGKTKMGEKMGAKDYSDAKVQDAVTDAAAIKAVKEGFKVGDKQVMKPTEGISDADAKAVVDYMRTFKK